MARSSDSSSAEEAAIVRLPQVFGIGFLGDHEPIAEAPCKAAILALLTEQKSRPDRNLYGMSTLASVFDLLCAECCVELKIPLQLCLSSDPDSLKHTFNPQQRARAEHVMSCALRTTLCAPEGSLSDRSYETGVEVVQQSEILIAYGDEAPTLHASTMLEVMDFARALNRPIFQIHQDTRVVSADSEGAKHRHDLELEFLNRLLPLGAMQEGTSPEALVRAWRSKLSANASAVAPKVRRLAAIPILCTSLAAVISGAAPRMHLKLIWTGIGTVLGLTAALLPAALRLGKRQALWVRIRTAAEVTRSVLAVWDTPLRYEVVGPEVLPELAGMVRSLNLLKAQASKNGVSDLTRFKHKYHEERVLDQMTYFSAQAAQAAARGKRYRLLSRVSIITAVVISAVMFASRFFLKTNGTPKRDAWLGLITSALFQAATVAGALLVVNDCDRRERRYKELHQSLRALDAELLAFRTWPLVNRVVANIERCLLVELIEWRSLLQNRKMPRN